MKRIRAQSTILYKTPVLSLLLSITAFSGRMSFIRPENAVGARSAQVCSSCATAVKPSYRFSLLPARPMR